MGEAGNGAEAASGGRGWLWGILVVVLLLAVSAWLALAPPAALVTPKVVAKLEEASGLKVRIAGAARYSMVPRFTMHLEDVTFSPPGGGDPVVKAQAMDMAMPMGVAFGGKGDILSLSLAKPVIAIVKGGAAKDSAGAASAAAGAPATVT